MDKKLTSNLTEYMEVGRFQSIIKTPSISERQQLYIWRADHDRLGAIIICPCLFKAII